MLNYSICKKCMCKHEPSWNKYDRARWKDLFEVNCPVEFAKEPYYAETRQPPPSWCPYSLEHAVCAGMKDA